MKLGLVIKTTNDGMSEAMSINKDESWARYIVDVRLGTNKLTNYDGTDKSVLLVKFLGKIGYLLVVIKSRPKGSGRPGDNTAAWIYIPAKCDISDTKIISILNDVKKAIYAEFGFDTNILNRVFNEDFEPKDVLQSAISTIVSNSNSEYAVRYYNGDFRLEELLGKALAQQEYSNYKGIFFIDAKYGISSNCKVLNFEPKKILSIPPFKNRDGFTACLLSQRNYVPFSKPIEVSVGTPIKIWWTKQGYYTIEKSWEAQDNDSYLYALSISPNEYYILVPRSAFKVVSAENGSPISDFEIRINDKPMEGNEMKVSEAVYKNGVKLSVRAKGYSEYQEDKVQLNMNSTKKITLQRKVYHYEFEIPTYIGEHKLENNAVVIIETHHKLEKSPIKGYYSPYNIQEGKNNQLYYDNGPLYKLKYIAIGIVACLLMILLWAGWQALDNYEFNLGWPPFKEIKQQPQTQWDNPEEDGLEEDFVENVDSLNAVAYLENNSTWHKDSLDKYEATRGLFEELNEFKNDNISRRAEKLGNVQKLEDIINAFNNSPYDHHIGKEANNGNYNSPTDNGISVDNYIKWISQQHFTEVSHPAPTPAPVSAPKTNKSKITGKTQKPANSASTTTRPATEQSQKPKRGGVN